MDKLTNIIPAECLTPDALKDAPYKKNMSWEAMTSEQKNMLVAGLVMGWEPKACDDDDVTLYDAGEMSCRNCGVYEHINSFEHGEPLPPRYTQSMGAAWLVVERMQSFYRPLPDHATREDLTLADHFLVYLWQMVGKRGMDAVFAYTPEVICKAALQAVGADLN